MSQNRENFEDYVIKLDANELEKLLKLKEYKQYKSIIQERIKTFYNILAKIKITDDYVELKNIQKSLKIGDYLNKILNEKINEVVKDELKNEKIKPLLHKREIELFDKKSVTRDDYVKKFEKKDVKNIDKQINNIKQKINELKENLKKYKSVNTINLYLKYLKEYLTLNIKLKSL